MRSNRERSKGLIFVLLLCLVMGTLFMSGINSGLADSPHGPPATASDLSNVTQNWDKALPAAQRFVVLPTFNNEAVRDNNTGLVWEKAPDDVNVRTWLDSLSYCANKSVGGTVGWRLPSVIELKSVQDPSVPAPFIPTNIFSGVQPQFQVGFHWTATTNAGDLTQAWMVLFDTSNAVKDTKTNLRRSWCVRGPMQESAY